MGLQQGFFSNRIDERSASALDGFRYEPGLISKDDETGLVEHIRRLPFRSFEFHGYLGKRRVVSFGWRYEFAGGGALKKADDIPDFVQELRNRVAKFANLEPHEFQHVLVTEYAPGAGIGWHRDKAVFGQVVGVSLLAPCVLRFRRKVGTSKGKRNSDKATSTKTTWDRINVTAEPRSAYLLTGPARLEWEHSILRVDALRYSITFRTMRDGVI